MFIVYKIIFNDRISNKTPPYYYIGSKSNCSYKNGVIYDKNSKPYFGSCKSKLFLNSLKEENNLNSIILFETDNFHFMLELERKTQIENNVVLSVDFFNAAIATSKNNLTNPDYTTCRSLSTGKIARIHKDDVDGVEWSGVTKNKTWYNNGKINKLLHQEDVDINWNKGRCDYEYDLSSNFHKNTDKEKVIAKSVETRKRNNNYVAYNKGSKGLQKHSEETKLKMSDERKGKGINTTIYSWSHPHHGIEELSQYDLYTKYNLSQSQISSLVSGRIKSHKKWKLIKCNYPNNI